MVCPDLAPNDFFFFPLVKDKLRSLRFASAQEVVNALKNEIDEVLLGVCINQDQLH